MCRRVSLWAGVAGSARRMAGGVRGWPVCAVGVCAEGRGRAALADCPGLACIPVSDSGGNTASAWLVNPAIMPPGVGSSESSQAVCESFASTVD